MAKVQADQRQDRLKSALRANLKRRKAQSRGRDGAGHDPAAVGGEGEGVPAEPGAPDKRGI
jgi:hypothetical protein